MTISTPTANERILAYIRTGVPYAIGSALAWVLVTFGLNLTGDFQFAAVTFAVAAVTNLYYWAARLIETRFPGAGVLLGWPAQPEYARVDNLWASLVRTAFPTLAAFLVSIVISALTAWTGQPIVIDQAGLAVIFVAVFEFAYYAAAKQLVARYTWLTFLLGTAAVPAYMPRHA